MTSPQLLDYDLGLGVKAFSTTRHGGYSQGAYGEMNINPYCGDEPEAVTRNREALAAALSLSADHIVLPHQVHGDRCLLVDGELFSLSPAERQQRLEGFDALMTDMPGVCISVSTADCIPILLHDLRHHAVAAIHAGWRGTVQPIISKTILAMQAHYGTDPADLYALIGPGISLKNFEVGQEVYEAFLRAGFPMDRIAKRYPIMQHPQTATTATAKSGRVWHDGLLETKWHIDLPQCNMLRLEACGVPPAQIQQCGICTFDRVGDFFSARRLGQASGRIFTAIVLH